MVSYDAPSSARFELASTKETLGQNEDRTTTLVDRLQSEFPNLLKAPVGQPVIEWTDEKLLRQLKVDNHLFKRVCLAIRGLYEKQSTQPTETFLTTDPHEFVRMEEDPAFQEVMTRSSVDRLLFPVAAMINDSPHTIAALRSDMSGFLIRLQNLFGLQLRNKAIKSQPGTVSIKGFQDLEAGVGAHYDHTEREIALGTHHLVNLFDGQSKPGFWLDTSRLITFLAESKGSLTHEGTHAYQHANPNFSDLFLNLSLPLIEVAMSIRPKPENYASAAEFDQAYEEWQMEVYYQLPHEKEARQLTESIRFFYTEMWQAIAKLYKQLDHHTTELEQALEPITQNPTQEMISNFSQTYDMLMELITVPRELEIVDQMVSFEWQDQELVLILGGTKSWQLFSKTEAVGLVQQKVLKLRQRFAQYDDDFAHLADQLPQVA